VDLLLTNAPSTDELAMLRTAAAELEHDVDEPPCWDDAEAFILRLSAVPSYNLRLQIWAFENSFDERFDIFQTAASDVHTACGVLQNSHQVKRLLALALAVGNHMNGGTSRGRADGFAIDALAQMSVVKAAQPGPVITLVDYIVRQLEQEQPGGLEKLFTEGGEVQAIHRATRHKVADLSQELAGYIAQANGLVKRTSSVQDDCDMLASRGQRVEMRLEEVTDLQSWFATVDDEYRQLCTYFFEGGGSRAIRAPDEFFTLWDGFFSAVRATLDTLYGGRVRRKKLGSSKAAAAHHHRPLANLKRRAISGDSCGGCASPVSASVCESASVFSSRPAQIPE